MTDVSESFFKNVAEALLTQKTESPSKSSEDDVVALSQSLSEQSREAHTSQDFHSAKYSDLEERQEKSQYSVTHAETTAIGGEHMSKPTKAPILPDIHSMRNVPKTEEKHIAVQYSYHSTHYNVTHKTNSQSSGSSTHQPEGSSCTIL